MSKPKGEGHPNYAELGFSIFPNEIAVWTKLPIREDLESTCEHVGRQAIEYSAKHKSAINGTNGKVCLIFSFKNPQNARGYIYNVNAFLTERYGEYKE